MATVTVIVGSSVASCSWYLYNGNGTLNSSGQIASGGNKSWTMAGINAKLVLSATPASGYGHPVYYKRTDGYNQNLTDDDEIYFTEDKTGTLSATYSPTVTYVLKYNGNGNTSGTAPSSQTGSTTYIVSEKGTLKKTGYNFKNWNTKSGGNGTSYSPGDTITLTGTTILYAQWKIKTYSVTYNAYSGTGAPSKQTKTYGEDLVLSTKIPTWTNHNFLGWATEKTRNAEVAWYPGDTYKANKALALYAVWECVASFYSQGSLVDEIHARVNANITLPTLPDTATSTFEGWISGTEEYSAGASIKITKHESFTAKWTTKGYRITYKGNYATSGEEYYQDVTGEFTVLECRYKKTGYYFDYWIYGNNVKYYPGDKITPTTNMSLYAHWTTKQYFYWHGSNEQDASYFAVGKRVDLAITATAWNNLYTYISNIQKAIGMSVSDFPSVAAGDVIKYSIYNFVSNTILQIYSRGYGSVQPVTVSPNQEIVTGLFNGSNGLKAAVNSIMDAL